MLAGMEQPTSGDILLRGERINDLPANRRPTCMVFQSLALFPHRTVGENIEFSLKIRGVAKDKRKARALELMDLLRLPQAYYGKNVMNCSGGERQRVALARALAYDPQILFFDEPLSAIDYKLRKTLEKELKDIHRETKKTFVYITHRLEEAMVMSDRIGVMREGKLVQVGTPARNLQLAHHPLRLRVHGRRECHCRSTLAAGGLLKSASRQGPVEAAAVPPKGFTSGHLVIRPEFLRFIGKAAEADNAVIGPPLQRICPGLAHPVPGARRRTGLHRGKAAPADVRRQARRRSAASAGTPRTASW